MRAFVAIGLLLLVAGLLAWRSAPVVEGRVLENVETALAEAGLTEVEVEADGREVTLVGEVVNLERKELAERLAAARGARSVLSRLTVTTLAAPPELEPDTPSAPAPLPAWQSCQQEMDELLAQGRIDFASSRAEIQQTSTSLLDALAEILERCGALRVEVAGHTDASGPREENLELSLRRAEAVVEYLVASGIVVERLTAVGYGPDRPLVDNATVEGRARNRRIEFDVEHPGP